MLKLNLANIKKIYKIAVVITDENCFYRANISHRSECNYFSIRNELYDYWYYPEYFKF